jgi:hypothetical protein
LLMKTVKQIRFQRVIKRFLFAVLPAIVIYSGCTKDLGKLPPPPPVELCDTFIPTYTKHIEPLLTAKCIGCHKSPSPSAGVLLTSYENVRVVADNGKLENVIFKGIPQFMPYGSQLPPHEKDLIRCWLTNGKRQ